ncbi:hypothetical protein [Rhizobium leguminosarum]|uniref:hypothetical protein n=1 Tax=Rhizobium leguminosarum TaxID=384 RepID=UPI0004B2960A|nr:hypothetical protein [Rhizobium leguminosarum]
MSLTLNMSELLSLIHTNGPARLKSNLARAFADEVAEAASRGFLTSLLDGEPSQSWRLTPQGLAALQWS